VRENLRSRIGIWCYGSVVYEDTILLLSPSLSFLDHALAVHIGVPVSKLMTIQ